MKEKERKDTPFVQPGASPAPVAKRDYRLRFGDGTEFDIKEGEPISYVDADKAQNAEDAKVTFIVPAGLTGEAVLKSLEKEGVV
jgi:hypothetical protein